MPPPATPASGPPQTILVVSHTGLVYWWPVWLVGFILSVLTYFDGYRLAIVPENTKVAKAPSPNAFELTVPGEAAGALGKAATNTADGKEAFPTRVSHSESYGVVFVTVILLVVFGSNVPLRGLSSLVALLLILLASAVMAYFDVWPRVFDLLGGLRIYMSAEAFFVPSFVLLLMWLATVFGYDRLRYMSFTPGQFVVHRDIGDVRQVYDTDHITAEKRPTDYFRHLVLGLGAGDIIIRVPQQNLTFEMPNVLFVNRRLREVADLMKTKPVIQG